MSSLGSITELLNRVKVGDASAAQKLWELCAARLAGLARTLLPAEAMRVSDEEDVALSAFASLILGAGRGRFTRLHDREDLWHLLAVITARKAWDQLAYDGRLRRRQPGTGLDSNFENGEATAAQEFDIEFVLDPRPPPDIELVVADECRRLLDSLRDTRLRAIAVWKLEGYTNDEIAVMIGCHLRTVERKLRLIRKIWSKEYPP